MIDTFSANLSLKAYQDVTRWVYVGVGALFGAIGISAGFVSTTSLRWVGLAAVLTTAIVVLSALLWPRRSRFPLLEIGGLLATAGWISAIWSGAPAATGFALFLPLVYGIATRRPWWPWAASTVFALTAAPLIAGLAGALSADGWLANQLVAMSFLGAQVAVFLSIELGWVVFARMDAHRADENELSLTRERLRFANELHDVQGHTLLAIKLKAELARRSLDRDVDTTRAELAEIERLVAEASVQTRQIANGYRTASLATELANAEKLFHAAGIRAEIEQAPAGLGAWEPLIATAIRESVSNILRHATPTAVTLRFSATSMVIQNDGAAVDRETGGGGGNGLRSLQDRFKERGGDVHWSLDGDVFTLTATRSLEGRIP
ncbi:histidine kinase [Micromonospora sp. NBC_01655]|uniref:histidine kinase n=1 Tax=Micromonospora sp. NBC_01655 TaxID=2975983 RepID=UPI00225118C3|nr:histidine kinase [Micromonospora sp. NBC_01655]MCX4471343.1 histidine kinase [Micromonospora sp. NBC_01655]